MQAEKSLSEWMAAELWKKDIDQRTPPGRFVVRCAQIVYSIARKFVDGQLSLEAMSLVYTTLLALVPLLAVMFSVLKALGVHNQAEPMLLELLNPLGSQAQEVTDQILHFVDNIRVGVLSSVGIAMLFYTVVSLLSKIEDTFNRVWHVARPRSLARRFSDYLSVILISPVLVFSAIGLTQSVLGSETVTHFTALEPFGSLLAGLTRLGPYLFICAVFAFIYGFVPNTRVRISTALIGGLFTGTLWVLSGKIFAGVVSNFFNYSAIYSGLASAILFMIWLYVGWLITLVGVHVTFYRQHPRFLDPRSEHFILTARLREELTLEIMTLVGRAHYWESEPTLTLDALEARHNRLPPGAVAGLVKDMLRKKLIVATDTDPPTYVPARDPGRIGLHEVLRAARGEPGNPTGLAGVDALVEQLDSVLADTLAGRTVKDLVR